MNFLCDFSDLKRLEKTSLKAAHRTKNIDVLSFMLLDAIREEIEVFLPFSPPHQLTSSHAKALNFSKKIFLERCYDAANEIKNGNNNNP
ncbi:CLUMA_CG015964, isoform A [Clunio marinus]|uniref:CLUMA_CG015964, isoform A n=1 Tax=Clunio marinus TaxID=568069 RepID=A0A1J1ITA1_9DIPT|nr:CLUMA_CG015964, isoform A [Clunio marinus]